MTFEPPEQQQPAQVPGPPQPQAAMPPLSAQQQQQQQQQPTTLPPQAPVPPHPSAQPVWARPAPVVVWQETPELEYHQLLRGAARYRWWKPLLALLLGTLYFLTFSVVFSLIAVPIYAIATGGDFTEISVDELIALDTQNPASLFIALGSIILMIPSAMLGMLSAGLGSPRRLWSVALKIRWRWIARTLLPAFIALVLMNVIGIALAIATSDPAELEASATSEPLDYKVNLALISLILVIVLVPLQAAAEELVFRGALMQALGAWFSGASDRTAFGRALRSPWLPILLPSVGFALMHIYDVWGLLAVGLMGAVCAWLTWRTGGLEAAISIHVVNNLVVFMLMTAAFGGETGQSADAGSPWSLIATAVGLLGYAWWVDRDFGRRDGRRTRIDVVQATVRQQPNGPQYPTGPQQPIMPQQMGGPVA